MLIVAGEVKVADSGEVEKAREALMLMVAETLKEEGCITYSFAQDIVEPTIVRIFEKWKDQATLDAHMESAHMLAFRGAMGVIKVEGLDVNVYEASGERPIS